MRLEFLHWYRDIICITEAYAGSFFEQKCWNIHCRLVLGGIGKIHKQVVFWTPTRRSCQKKTTISLTSQTKLYN
jgi:hypothetical protein